MLRKLSVDTYFNYRKKDDKDPFFYPSTLYRLAQYNDGHIDLDRVYKYCGTVSPFCEFTMKHLINLGADNIFLNTLSSHIKYREDPYTNYIPSKPLLEVLDKIDVDMPCDQVQEDYRAYFEFNGFNGLSYAIVSVECQNIRICFCKDIKSDASYFGVKLINGTNLLERIKTHKYTEPSLVNGEVKIVEKQLPEEMERILNLVINLIIYTSNPNEEFKKKFNEFSPKHKVAQKERLEYTEKPFVEIGFDAEFLRLLTVEVGMVRPHARWQPCGPNREQRKLIIVKAHERKYRKEIQ